MALICVSAPTRIADLGGWTDTWFARHGAVCHLAVWPGVDVRIAPYDGPPGVQVRLRNFAREWHWSAGTPPQVCPDPLIGACLDEAEIPDGAWVLNVGSSVPPGASMGTSASVCVAALAALDQLRGAAMDAASLARRAHLVETLRLSQQSGIQDQWAAAAGGAALIEMARYPSAQRTPLALSPDKDEWVERLLMRVDGVQQVKESKYILLHAPRSALPEIRRLLPGSEYPTIIPLEGSSDKVAVHAVCRENVFWETLESLKKAGASSLLVLPVEKMLA